VNESESLTAQVRDPDGRVVELTAERWEHITSPDGNPELADLQDAVLRAVGEPDVRRPGREPNEEWFFLAGIGSSRWLQVVVGYGEGRGWIVAAFARRTDP
jgi:hypothetical protein